MKIHVQGQSRDAYLDFIDDSMYHPPHTPYEEEIPTPAPPEEDEMLYGYGIAGETISEGDLVAFNVTDNKIYKADKDVVARKNFIGLATENAILDASFRYQVGGVFTAAHDLGVSGVVYVGNMGAITFTKPVTGSIFKIGFLTDATHLVIQCMARINI